MRSIRGPSCDLRSICEKLWHPWFGCFSGTVGGREPPQVRPRDFLRGGSLNESYGVVLILGWIRNRRRTKILARPFPDEWDGILTDNVHHEQRLTDLQRVRLRKLTAVFVAEKNWEGCGGLTVTDEIRVTIAAQACLLAVGMADDFYFDHVLSILVYPTGYIATGTEMTHGGVVIEGDQTRLGEAWWRGPVVLSWSDALAGGRMESAGHNLVLHEFAHQLDLMNGRSVDGTPLLESREQLTRWIKVMEPAFERHAERCRHGRHGCIDCYGAKNPGEFFAVLTEMFFERPELLRSCHADIYCVLSEFYHLDPAFWIW